MVIDAGSGGHDQGDMHDGAATRVVPDPASRPQDLASERDDAGPTRARARLRAVFEAHYDLVWRSLRRFGVPEADVDDAAQEAFMVFSRRIEQVERGKERAFLLGTAYRVASDARRARQRRPGLDGATEPDTLTDGAPSLEDLTDRRRARALLEEVLESMPEDARAVFVLYELEGLAGRAIAEALDLPQGTVASRLRRGREAYEQAVRRIRARLRREVDDA